MRRIAVPCAATLLAAIVLAPRAHAQGFAVYEHDACAMARGAAAVADPCNQASAVFYNPAAMLGGTHKLNVEANLTMIAPTGNFTDSATRVQTDLNKKTFPVPAGYLSYQLSRRLAIGAGVFAPYGLTTDWPVMSPGRFMAYKTTIASIYVQPTIAFQVTPRIQIGAGVDYVHSSAQVHRRVDASTVGEPAPGGGGVIYLGQLGIPAGTDFADATFDVSGNGWGGHVGVLIRATDRLSIGARYLSQVKINFTGTASFKQVPTGITLAAGNPLGLPGGTPLDYVLLAAFQPDSLLSTQSAATSITMPAQLVVGLSYKLLNNLTVLADWQHTNWSAFKTLDLTLAHPQLDISEYEGYKNTDAFRLGLDWQATPGVAVRLGALRHNGAAPDVTVTPLLPEGNRVEGTAGLGLKLTPNITLDLAYQYLQQQDRRGRVMEPPPGQLPTTALNTGLYKFTANLFAASLSLAL